MNYRRLGKTDFKISEISLGTWQLGGRWGDPFNDKTAEEILNNAIDAGVNFIDTADVYNLGKSEKSIGKILKSRPEKIYVATKCGRQINPHTNKGYTPEVLQKYVEDSLKNMHMETLDLIQLHCPPTEVYYRPEIFEMFDRLKDQGKIKNLGVSVEKVEEALKAIEYPNVTTVQIIFNMFRHRPASLFFEQASKKDVGIIVRVPLASGLLTGKLNRESTFEKHDHRFFNRNGMVFDKGETFSGVPFETGLEATGELKKVFNTENLAPWALKWILQFKEVSCIIPGASRVDQVTSNLSATELPDIDKKQHQQVIEIYKKYIYAHVHHLW